MIIRYNSCYSCHSEKLCIVKFLSLIGYIDILIRRIKLFPLHKGTEIRCGIECRTVRLSDNTWRQFLLISLNTYINYQCTLRHSCNLSVFKILYKSRDIRIRIRFSFPKVKIHKQRTVVFLQILYRQVHNMLPDGSVWLISLLKFQCSFLCSLLKVLVHL